MNHACYRGFALQEAVQKLSGLRVRNKKHFGKIRFNLCAQKMIPGTPAPDGHLLLSDLTLPGVQNPSSSITSSRVGMSSTTAAPIGTARVRWQFL